MPSLMKRAIEELSPRRRWIMPLSDDERRRLEELESRLRSDDPMWARTIGNGRPRDGGPRKLVLAILAFLVGLTLVLAGAATRLVLMGGRRLCARVRGSLLAPGRPGHCQDQGVLGPFSGWKERLTPRSAGRRHGCAVPLTPFRADPVPSLFLGMTLIVPFVSSTTTAMSEMSP